MSTYLSSPGLLYKLNGNSKGEQLDNFHRNRLGPGGGISLTVLYEWGLEGEAISWHINKGR